MKRLLPVLLAVFAIPAMGQKSKPGLRTIVQNQLRTESTVNYSFSQSTATYTSLTGATDINGGTVWDDPDVRIEIPFTFWLNGITPDSLDFYFSFGSSLGAYDYSNLNLMGIISPFETDVIDRGTVGGTTQSTIQYKVDGTAPNRILKIEWKNVGNYDEWDNLGTTNDFANFQVWLYETTNKVEYRFGSSTINNPQFWFYGAPGAPVGIGNLDGMGDLSDAHFLRGAPANPMMVDSLDYLTGFPASGTVYTFSQLTVGLDED
ncbi:MAG: hypothetical protein LPK79_05755, partial [Bacteroidota bacterium]|nr:hypothetical protein [Bacteroidota bacterium]